jgi:cytochrome P450 PksS
MDSAVTELLRYDSPVHFPIARTALEDMEIGGRLLRKGESLLGLLGSANRDESVFPDADRLDITRTPNRHLGFGMGIHFCLGAQLARMEAKIALGRLLERFPNLRLAVPRDQLRWHMSAGFRGLNALPLAA